MVSSAAKVTPDPSPGEDDDVLDLVDHNAPPTSMISTLVRNLSLQQRQPLSTGPTLSSKPLSPLVRQPSESQQLSNPDALAKHASFFDPPLPSESTLKLNMPTPIHSQPSNTNPSQPQKRPSNSPFLSFVSFLSLTRPLFRADTSSRHYMKLEKYRVHTFFLHFVDVSKPQPNQICHENVKGHVSVWTLREGGMPYLKRAVEMERQYRDTAFDRLIPQCRRMLMAFAVAMMIYYAITYALVKPVPPNFSEAYPEKGASAFIALGGYILLKCHKTIHSWRYFNLILLALASSVCILFQASDDFYYFRAYQEQGGLENGPFEVFIRPLWVVLIYAMGICQTDFSCTIIASFIFLIECPRLRSLAVDIYQYGIEILRRKIFVLENVISHALLLQNQTLKLLQSEAILDLAFKLDEYENIEDVKSIISKLTAVHALEGHSVPQPKLKPTFVEILWRPFKSLSTKTFKDPKDELDFNVWKLPGSLTTLRLNAGVDLLVFILDPFFNEISFCNRYRSSRSPSICPESGLGPFIKTFRLAFYPTVTFLMLFLSALRTTPSFLQRVSIVHAVMVCWATIYLMGRIGEQDFAVSRVPLDSTMSLFSLLFYTRMVSFGCGSKIPVRYLGLGFVFIVATSFPLFKIVAPHATMGSFLYVFLNGCVAAVLVWVNVKGAEEMERRLFVLLRLFESEICQTRFDHIEKTQHAVDHLDNITTEL
ncbi:hypothetical protein HDU97_003676 [Phlyctochytrium planicorne]|nr:hypothetical protein HDU97_003676 [Phlyctochytrium planicorne]